MTTKSKKKAGRLSRVWNRVSKPWRWTLLGEIPRTVIAGAYAVTSYFAFNAGSRSPGVAYTVTTLVIFPGTPGTILLMEKRPH